MSSGAYPGLHRNAVVAASAGTGKTHFLTNVYVGRALGLAGEGKPVSPERIVATTFSRAAALELESASRRDSSSSLRPRPLRHSRSVASSLPSPRRSVSTIRRFASAPVAPSPISRER